MLLSNVHHCDALQSAVARLRATGIPIGWCIDFVLLEPVTGDSSAAVKRELQRKEQFYWAWFHANTDLTVANGDPYATDVAAHLKYREVTPVHAGGGVTATTFTPSAQAVALAPWADGPAVDLPAPKKPLFSLERGWLWAEFLGSLAFVLVALGSTNHLTALAGLPEATREHTALAVLITAVVVVVLAGVRRRQRLKAYDAKAEAWAAEKRRLEDDWRDTEGTRLRAIVNPTGFDQVDSARTRRR